MCDKEIFAVSKGEYSDYAVMAVFTTESAAILYRDQLSLIEWDTRIEMLPLDPEPPTIVEGVEVLMGRDGEVLIPPKPKYYRLSYRIGFRFYGFNRDDTRTLCWTVQTGDVKRAIKVVNEKRTMLIAADAWANVSKTREILGLVESK